MKLLLVFLCRCLFLVILIFTQTNLFSQNLSSFNIPKSVEADESPIINELPFNGYTTHWSNVYKKWHRYGNLFKMGSLNIKSTILQSKIDIAEDFGMPGLLMQEGFLAELLSAPYSVVENPSTKDLEKKLDNGNVLVVVHSNSELKQKLENKATHVFEWADHIQSHQLKANDLKKIKTFYLVNNDRHLFVISAHSKAQSDFLLQKINSTSEILEKYKMHKGWFGASTLLKSVTCTAGHPLELIGRGMNEGNSWFIFDGYMEFMAKKELKEWVKEVELPIVANVGFSPIYGCENYNGLQVQDMATKQAWIDYAHEKGGYVFRPVYDPDSDSFEFDGYIVHEGNKEQIDNENIPFINKTGMLSNDMTSSMILFIEKETSLTNESIWKAIMNRREVAVLEQAKMMGPARYRNALQLLYLDKHFIESYFTDKLDLVANVEGYDLVVDMNNYSSGSISGKLEIKTSGAIKVKDGFSGSISLNAKDVKQIRIPLVVKKEAMGRTNPIAIHFSWDKKKKSTLTMLDLPPAISVHQVLYGHAPKVDFPVSIHNFSGQKSFPVTINVYNKNNSKKPVLKQTKICETPTASYSDLHFDLKLNQGEYSVEVNALNVSFKSQLGVGKALGKVYLYELDLNSDGINEYRMENDSVQITLLRTGARVIEYIVKSKKDNVLFKIWPEKTFNHKQPFRKNRFYPFGGFEDFLGQPSMETHKIYDAKIIQKDGDFVRVEMETDYYGNKLKKTFTLYGNSPLLEVRFALNFINPEANVIGPQPILELGKVHGTEDVFIIPTTEGLEEYRMRPEKYFGHAFDIKEGWNAGYDSFENVSFVGAFPVKQPIFLHMWMNHPDNSSAPHYYAEFQPWVPIIQKNTMYFSYYIWGSGETWQKGLKELRKRNLISTK